MEARITASPAQIGGNCIPFSFVDLNQKDKHMLYIANGFSVQVIKKPNAFNRLMQRIFFGFQYKTL